MSRPFVWGRCDCATAACDVYAALHGIDPLRAFRGAYRSRAEAEAFAAGHGGMAALFARLMTASGAVQRDPLPGDLALTPEGSFAYQAVLVCVAPGVFASKGLRGMWTSYAADLAHGPS